MELSISETLELCMRLAPLVAKGSGLNTNESIGSETGQERLSVVYNLSAG